MESIQKTFWLDAAKAGMVLGVAIVAFSVVCWLMRLSADYMWVSSLFNFAAIAVCVYVYGEKRAALYRDVGFSYGQSMSYILAIMLFSGFISGVGTYMMQNHIGSEYYQEIIDVAMLNSGLDIDDPKLQETMGMAQKLMHSPMFIILSSLFNMLIYGCFIGLIASVFIKKDPNPFSNQNDAE